MFDWCVGDDQFVEFFVCCLYFVEGVIEVLQMVSSGVVVFVIGYVDQLEVDLQWGCVDDVGELVFGLDFFGYQVQKFDV